MYADDTSLCLKSKDISQLNEAINDDLEHLDSWLKGNKLSLNVAKTRSMLIATKPSGGYLSTVCGTETCHFLGVLFSSRYGIMGIIFTNF